MVRRRTFLRLGVGGVAALTGCASVARQIESHNAAPVVRNAVPPSDAGSSSGGSSGSGSSFASVAPAKYAVESVSTSLADVPIPDDPSAFDYATMGSGDRTTVTLYGNWKCPFTREFVVQDFPRLAERYVASGELDIEFRALAYKSGQPYLGPDAPRAAWGGLAVWAHDPASFWRYFATVFHNQPPELAHWATLSQLLEFARAADAVNRKAIAADVHKGARDDRVRETTTAADRVALQTVPRFEYDGTLVAPNLEPNRTRALLDTAARA